MNPSQNFENAHHLPVPPTQVTIPVGEPANDHFLGEIDLKDKPLDEQITILTEKIKATEWMLANRHGDTSQQLYTQELKHLMQQLELLQPIH